MSEEPVTWPHRGTLVKILLADGLMRCSECHQAVFTMAELAQLVPCEVGDGLHRVQTRPIYDGRQIAAWCTACDWWMCMPYPDGDLRELALNDASRQHLNG